MSCACIQKREFDISVTHKGCEYLVLEDQSMWVEKLGYDKPNTYDVLIKIPSRNVEVIVPINVKGKTFLTSVELFGSKNVTCLPDDIYCMTTTTCGYDLTINRAYLCSLDVKLNELVAKFATTMNQEQRTMITDIRLEIAAIRINAEKGNINLANSLFKIVKDKLKKYHCDDC